MLPICECMTFDEFISDVCIMQLWCDDIFILFWINYGDVGFMPILTSDDGVFVLCCFIVESHTLHKRRGLSCQAMMAFMPSDDGFYAERRSTLCQVSLITDKAMGTTCIT